MKKIALLLVIFMLTGSLFCLFADESSLSANDLEIETLTTLKEVDGFKLYGTEAKPIDIQEIDERTAEDGEIFNNRIKLSGTGKTDLLCIGFSAKKGQKVTVYLNSSSKTDERVLNLYTPQSKDALASIPAPPAKADDFTAGMGTFVIPFDGEFLIGSANKGIYVYAIVIED